MKKAWKIELYAANVVLRSEPKDCEYVGWGYSHEFHGIAFHDRFIAFLEKIGVVPTQVFLEYEKRLEDMPFLYVEPESVECDTLMAEETPTGLRININFRAGEHEWSNKISYRGDYCVVWDD